MKFAVFTSDCHSLLRRAQNLLHCFSSGEFVDQLVEVVQAGLQNLFADRAVRPGSGEVALDRRAVRKPREQRKERRSKPLLSSRLRIKTPDIVVADGIASPFVWCFGKTKIVWPSRLLDASIDQKRFMLIHEAAHLRRRDHWTAWIEVLV